MRRRQIAAVRTALRRTMVLADTVLTDVGIVSAALSLLGSFLIILSYVLWQVRRRQSGWNSAKPQSRFANDSRFLSHAPLPTANIIRRTCAPRRGGCWCTCRSATL